MKQLITTLFTVILFLSTRIETQAQTYKHAVGVRLGTGNGVTYKTFIAQHKALDFSLDFSSGSDHSTFRLTGLYEIHSDTGITPGLFWYYGGGASLGARRNKRIDTNDLLLSVDGVIGLDYKFERVPINLALDWQASVELAPSAELDLGGLSLSIRYTF